MAIQTRYTKNGHSFDCEVTPEFQSAYDATIAAYPVLEYPIDMGIKQSVTDYYASKTVAADIEGAGLKKWDAIMTGTVGAAGRGDRQPTRTPMEREVWRIAFGELAEIFAKKAVPKDRQAAYVRMLIERDWERLEEEARLNLEANAAVRPDAFADLDALYAEADEDEESDDNDES